MKKTLVNLAVNFFGVAGLTLGFYVYCNGDPFTPIFLFIPSIFLLAFDCK